MTAGISSTQPPYLQDGSSRVNEWMDNFQKKLKTSFNNLTKQNVFLPLAMFFAWIWMFFAPLKKQIIFIF